MCGIAGILFPRRGDTRARLARMAAAIAHRGEPGRSGCFVDGSAALACHRLALVGGDGGSQPMSDRSGRYHLVWNGEIYNHRALRAELSQERFATDSDTETLLAAFAAYGEACVDRLDGMFALVVWDARERRAFAARDALGVKPLTYRRDGAEVRFASEAKAILADDGGAPRIATSAIVDYLLAPSLSGVLDSPFEGIEHLGAGERMWIDDGAVRRARWFHYRVGEGARFADREAAAVELRDALTRSVAASLGADQPVGMFLSGGVDSTAIAAIAAPRSAPLNAFTIRFDQHGEIDFAPTDGAIVISDDAPFAEEAARAFPIALERVTAPRDGMLAVLDAVARDNDRIPAWEQELSQHVLARAAARSVKAVLVGDAADETHFGYWFLLDEATHFDPIGLIDRFGAVARERCLAPRLRAGRPREALAARYRALCDKAGYRFTSPGERTRAITHLVVTLWLGRLLHNGDVHTMAHTVEARVPFAGRELLAVAARVPPEWGFADGVEKRLLRAAVAPLIPPSIAARKKSALPRDPRVAALWQGALRRAVTDDADFAHHVLDLPAVERLCALPRPSEAERALCFNLLALLSWHRHYRG